MKRTVALVATILAAVLLWPGAEAQATQSVPTPHYYWDVGDNGSPDAGAYTIRTAGNNDALWTAAREARIQSARTEWDNDTQWNPNANFLAAPANCFELTTCHGVKIDGTQPPSECGGPFSGNDIALNCFLITSRFDAEGTPYKDISDSDIWFWTAGAGHPTFTYSAAGSTDPDIFDFQGILTHEMGHAIYLFDLGITGFPPCINGNNLETMCGVVSGDKSTFLRTLQPDDITSANIVY